MNYWTLSPKNIWVAGHRGWPAVYPENTMPSFRAALEVGVDQIETDVRITKDGKLVLFHDATVDRTTDGTGRVDEMTFEEGAVSWYKNVYLPIAEAIEEEHLLSDFPGQTEADMYMWRVRRWDEMKRVDALATQADAVRAAKRESRKEHWKRWFSFIRQKLSRK